MEVILKKSVEGLGAPGDVLKVADGYARNYLLPMQLAVHATERNRRHLEHEKRVIDHQEAKNKEHAQEIACADGWCYMYTESACRRKRSAFWFCYLYGYC